MSGLKDWKVDKKQTYTKTEACKLYSRVFWIFLPNGIKIDPYNFELYRFKVCAFLSETQCIWKGQLINSLSTCTTVDQILHYMTLRAWYEVTGDWLYCGLWSVTPKWSSQCHHRQLWTIHWTPNWMARIDDLFTDAADWQTRHCRRDYFISDVSTEIIFCVVGLHWHRVSVAAAGSSSVYLRSLYTYTWCPQNGPLCRVVASICVNPFLTARQHSLLCRALS